MDQPVRLAFDHPPIDRAAVPPVLTRDSAHPIGSRPDGPDVGVAGRENASEFAVGYRSFIRGFADVQVTTAVILHRPTGRLRDKAHRSRIVWPCRACTDEGP